LGELPRRRRGPERIYGRMPEAALTFLIVTVTLPAIQPMVDDRRVQLQLHEKLGAARGTPQKQCFLARNVAQELLQLF
jgi:hypothetical protein